VTALTRSEAVKDGVRHGGMKLAGEFATHPNVIGWLQTANK